MANDCTITLRLPRDLAERVREQSRTGGLPMSELIRYALEDAFPPVREHGRDPWDC
jgi:predicted DNA binding CopG/RHH family protein